MKLEQYNRSVTPSVPNRPSSSIAVPDFRSSAPDLSGLSKGIQAAGDAVQKILSVREQVQERADHLFSAENSALMQENMNAFNPSLDVAGDEEKISMLREDALERVKNEKNISARCRDEYIRHVENSFQRFRIRVGGKRADMLNKQDIKFSENAMNEAITAGNFEKAMEHRARLETVHGLPVSPESAVKSSCIRNSLRIGMEQKPAFELEEDLSGLNDSISKGNGFGGMSLPDTLQFRADLARMKQIRENEEDNDFLVNVSKGICPLEESFEQEYKEGLMTEQQYRTRKKSVQHYWNSLNKLDRDSVNQVKLAEQGRAKQAEDAENAAIAEFELSLYDIDVPYTEDERFTMKEKMIRDIPESVTSANGQLKVRKAISKALEKKRFDWPGGENIRKTILQAYKDSDLGYIGWFNKREKKPEVQFKNFLAACEKYDRLGAAGHDPGKLMVSLEQEIKLLNKEKNRKILMDAVFRPDGTPENVSVRKKEWTSSFNSKSASGSVRIMEKRIDRNGRLMYKLSNGKIVYAD